MMLDAEKRGRSSEPDCCLTVIFTLYLHAVDQLSGKELVKPHILPDREESDHNRPRQTHHLKKLAVRTTRKPFVSLWFLQR